MFSGVVFLLPKCVVDNMFYSIMFYSIMFYSIWFPVCFLVKISWKIFSESGFALA